MAAPSSNAKRAPWMWLEAGVCLAWPLFATLMGTLVSFHYLVVTLRGESRIPIEQYTTVLYSAGSWLGIGAVLIMLTTQLGATASKASLSIVKAGLAVGAAVSLAIPEGAWPQLRFIHNFDIPREIFLSALPTFCFAHFAWVGRAYLSSQGGKARSIAP
jgi:hypothetical protein